jgi:hypothetical protein
MICSLQRERIIFNKRRMAFDQPQTLGYNSCLRKIGRIGLNNAGNDFRNLQGRINQGLLKISEVQSFSYWEIIQTIRKENDSCQSGLINQESTSGFACTGFAREWRPPMVVRYSDGAVLKDAIS